MEVQYTSIVDLRLRKMHVAAGTNSLYPSPWKKQSPGQRFLSMSAALDLWEGPRLVSIVLTLVLRDVERVRSPAHCMDRCTTEGR